MSAALFEAVPAIAGRYHLIPPKTHHSKKIVRMGRFSRLVDSPELRSAHATWLTALKPFAPPAPIQCALGLEFAFTWPMRNSDRRRAGIDPNPLSRPDCDNFAKMTMAVLCFFRDDAQVVDLHISKCLGDQPGLDFRIWRLG